MSSEPNGPNKKYANFELTVIVGERDNYLILIPTLCP